MLVLNLRRLVLLMAVALATALAQAADSDTKEPTTAEKPDVKTTVIKPAEAAEHYGKEVTVEFTVNNGKLAGSKGPCFLNSEKDFRSEKNFTVVIFEKVLDKFKDDKIDDPYAHFKGKKVSVTGKIEKHKDRPQIQLAKTKDIKLADEADKPTGDAKPATDKPAAAPTEAAKPEEPKKDEPKKKGNVKDFDF